MGIRSKNGIHKIALQTNKIFSLHFSKAQQFIERKIQISNETVPCQGHCRPTYTLTLARPYHG